MNKGKMFLTGAAISAFAVTGAGWYSTNADTICTTVTGTDTVYDNLLEGGSIARYVVNTTDGQELDNTANAFRGKSEADTEHLQAFFQAGATYEIEVASSNILAATEIPAGTCSLTPVNG